MIGKLKIVRISASAGGRGHISEVNLKHDIEKHGNWQGGQVSVGEWCNPKGILSTDAPHLNVTIWENLDGEGEYASGFKRKGSAHIPLELILDALSEVEASGDNGATISTAKRMISDWRANQ